MSSKKLYIQVNDTKNLKDILDYFWWLKISFKNDIEQEMFEKSIDLLKKAFWAINIDWFVIWSEFCEHLYYKLNWLEELILFLKEKELVVHTSILTIYNENYYKKLFNLLKEREKTVKIIINDIWFIKMMDELWFKNKHIIIGRLILKQKKIFNINNKTNNIFNDQSVNLDLFNSFFNKQNINSYAIDILPQWNQLIDDYNNKFLYFPWWYYTSSRWCVTKSKYSGKNYAFPLKSCDRPCIWTYMKFDNMDYLIWKGNSVFYKSIDFVDIDDFKKYDNFIFQPFFPM